MMAKNNNNIEGLDVAIRTAATEALGVKTPTAKSSDGNTPLASIRTARTDGTVNRRMGQYSGGGANSTVGPPSFYAPWLTASSWQIPNNRKEIYLWAQWWVDNEPKVAAGIEFYTDFPLSGFTLECANAYVKDYFEKLNRKLKITKKTPQISQEYHLRGDCFVLASLECEICGGMNEDPETGEPCKHEGASWKGLSILNPDHIEVHPAMLDQEPEYFFLPDDMMKKVVQERRPEKLYNSMRPEMRKLIQSGQPIHFSPECIYHFKRGGMPWQPFGTSLLRRLFQTLAYKDKLRQAQWLVAERHIIPVKIVKVGDKDRPATEDDLIQAQDELTALANDPLLTIVTHHAFDFDYVGACYSDDTEVLTQNGYKLFKDVASDEMVACMNQETKHIEWHVPQARHEHFYDSSLFGPMISLSSKQFDVVVTPNHELLIQKRKWNPQTNSYKSLDWDKVRADQVTDNDRINPSADWIGTTPDILPYQDNIILQDVDLENYLKFVGYYLSEGSLKTHPKTQCGYCSVCVYQKSGTESDTRIEQVMRHCFGEKSTSKDISVQSWEPVNHYAVHSVELCKHILENFGHGSEHKHIPRWILELPKKELKIILDALMDGDGDSRPSGKGQKHRYSTTSIELANAVQEIVLKLGYNPKIKFNDENREKDNHLPMHRVYWCDNTTTNVIRSRNISKIDYKGNVYCFTVPTGILITRRNGKIGIHGNSGKVLQLTNEYENLNQDIIDGLMLNKAIINGEGPSYSNAQVGLLTMAKRLERFREEVAYWMEECLYKPVAMWNGFTTEGKRGQIEYVYPTVKWDDLQLRDDTGKLQTLLAANQAGIVSNQSVVEALGLPYDQEVERLRFEQGSSFISSPDLMNTDMNNGFGGMGNGFRGALPGMPGGANIATPGSPTAPMGAPDMGGMPGLAPAASSDWKANYRFASAASGDMYDLQLATCTNEQIIRTASRKILSAAHREYIESIAPVTGRGLTGSLEIEPQDIFEQLPVGPNDGGPFCTAMNRAAIYELTQLDKKLGENNMVRTGAKKGDVKQTYRFTSLEQKLYKILMQAGLPFAWYAQYLAGPITQHFEYQLDAAIPALKLGLEADGEIYHSNPEKIAKDRKRDSLLATQGWTILRFTETELNEHPEEILKVIMQMIRRLMGAGEHIGSTVLL